GAGALHGRLLDLTLPVLGLEAADQLARALAHRIAILAERVDVDRLGEIADLGALHADAEVSPSDAEALHPGLVEDLGAPGEHRIEEDVLRSRDMPDDPGDGVEVLAGADAHLLVAEPVEHPLGGETLVAADAGGVHGAVLRQKQITHIHAGSPRGVNVRAHYAGSPSTRQGAPPGGEKGPDARRRPRAAPEAYPWY